MVDIDEKDVNVNIDHEINNSRKNNSNELDKINNVNDTTVVTTSSETSKQEQGVNSIMIK